MKRTILTSLILGLTILTANLAATNALAGDGKYYQKPAYNQYGGNVTKAYSYNKASSYNMPATPAKCVTNTGYASGACNRPSCTPSYTPPSSTPPAYTPPAYTPPNPAPAYPTPLYSQQPSNPISAPAYSTAPTYSPRSYSPRSYTRAPGY